MNAVRFTTIVAWACLLTTGAQSQVQSDPRYKLNREQTRVLELSNLSPGDDCQSFRTGGRVVKRVFDEKLATRMIGFTIEESRAQRTYINVDVQPDTLDRVTAGWIMQGLQALVREGARLSIGAKACGAAGRVIMADWIRPMGGSLK